MEFNPEKEPTEGLNEKDVEKSKLKQQFANLTDDDLMFAEGKKDADSHTALIFEGLIYNGNAYLDFRVGVFFIAHNSAFH